MKSILIGSLLFAALVGTVFYFSAGSTSLRAKTRSLKEFALFNEWQMTHEKSYESEDELMMRFGIWYNAHHEIADHNSQKLNWTMGHNQFSDLTYQEFSDQYLCANMMDLVPKDDEEEEEEEENRPDPPKVPDSVDWVAKGAVNDITNQGRCGSCWAFAGVASLEGQYFNKHQKLYKFSEQQQIDCTHQECNGGFYTTCYNYWKHDGAVELSCYPYLAKKQTTCNPKGCKEIGFTTGYQKARGGENGLRDAAAENIIAVAVDASYNWQRYNSGIWDGQCTNRITHAVTLVGYGPGYWKIRNSWNTWWGESGYMRMVRHDGTGGGKCAVASYGYYAVAK